MIGVIYRHPNHSYHEFQEKLCNQLLLFDQMKIKYYIVGDFNINLLKYNLTSNVTNYLNALHSVGCSIFTDKPTRITSHSSSCIDHIYSNLPSHMLDNYIILAEISDHFGTLTKINSLPRKSKTNHVFVRKSNLDESEWQQFNAELADSLSHNIPYQHLLNPSYLSNAITDNYKTVIDKFMPEKKSERKY